MTVAVDGLSAGTIRQIAAVERALLGPGAVAAAAAGWRRTVHGPTVRLPQDAAAGCPCCDPLACRDVLESLLPALGPRARREVQRLIGPWDDLYERRTHHDPTTAPELPWWRRRT